MEWLLVRMARWVRRPPSREHVYVAAGVILFAAAIYIIEQNFGWPDWMTLEPRGRRFFPKLN
jgi:hypothetical protein